MASRRKVALRAAAVAAAIGLGAAQAQAEIWRCNQGSLVMLIETGGGRFAVSENYSTPNWITICPGRHCDASQRGVLSGAIVGGGMNQSHRFDPGNGSYVVDISAVGMGHTETRTFRCVRANAVAQAPPRPAPRPAAPAGGATAFPGRWLYIGPIEVRDGSRFARYLNGDGTTKSGSIATAQFANVDERNGGGVRTNILEFEINCAARTARELGGQDYDAAHRPVASPPNSSAHVPVAPNTVGSVMLNYACFGETTGLAPATGDLQAHALRLFARPVAPRP